MLTTGNEVKAGDKIITGGQQGIGMEVLWNGLKKTLGCSGGLHIKHHFNV